MSTPYPLDHLRVEIAPGAVLSAAPDTWPWVDITEFIHQKDEITYTSGQRDEAQSTLPSVVTLTVDNTDGRFSPRNPLGPWFGQLSLNTPLRLFWDADPVSEIVFVSEWPPRWDMTAIQATVVVTADGITRRLEQGAQALDSPLFRALSTHDNVVAYWPCEDGRDATEAASPIAGVNPLNASGVTFGESAEQSDSVLFGAESVMRIDENARNVVGRVPNHTPTDYYVVELAWLMPETATSTRAIMNVYTTSPDFARWQIWVSPTTFQLRALDADNTVVVDQTETVNDALWGQWVRAELFLSESVTSGMSVRARLAALDAKNTELNNIGDINVGSGSMGRIVRAGVAVSEMFQTRYAGHIAVLAPTSPSASVFFLNASDIPRFHAPYHAFTGELAADRFERLCDDEGLSCSVVAPTGGLQLPGAVGSNASTPDAASLDITGDLDVRAWLTRDDWLLGNDGDVVSKYDYGGERSWRFGIGNDGEIYFRWTADGTSGTESVVESDPVVPTPDGSFWEPGKGQFIAVRATLDVDDGSSQHVGTIYIGPSLDGPWTQIHTETLAGTTSIFASDVALRVGANDVNALFFGEVRQARVYDGIDGTLVAFPDFTAQDIGATSFDDDQGNTWTVNGDAAIVRADDTMPMGPQQIDTLVTNLRDVADTDGGRLSEHMGGFRYRTRTDLYNQDVALALDQQGRLSESPEPTDDDQQLRNDVTAQSPFGTSARATDQESVSRLGRYDTSLQVNPETSDQLLQIANWALHLGTVDEMRWPRIDLAFHKDPDLVPAWLALQFGDRITLDQELAQLPGIDVDQLIIGSSQRFTRFRWDVALNCIPAQPYTVAVFDTSRFDTAGSETSGSFDAGADTSLTVATNKPTDGLRLWGAPGDYASTPDHASLDITGDIELEAWITPRDWVPGVRTFLVAKYQTTGNQRSYALTLDLDGTLQMTWSTDGTGGTLVMENSTQTPPVPPSGRLAVRGVLDVDNGAGGYDVTFYTAETPDGPWTQLGDVVTGGSTTSIFSSSSDLYVGSYAESNEMPGVVHAATVRDGIDGTEVANPDFAAQPDGETSFADSASRTWTVNGTAYIFHTRPWVNTTDHASEFPFEITVAGVVLNVTAISSATSPQTFTVDQAPVNGVEKTIPSGSAVSLAVRPVFAL